MAKHRIKKQQSVPRIVSTPVVALLAWLIPGLGHWAIGERSRGLIIFVVVCVTFWGGVAIAGVRTATAPKGNGAWIAAQLVMGPQGLAALGLARAESTRTDPPSIKAPWPSSSIGIVYAGVAGLLNLIVIIDVLARAESIQASSAASKLPPRKQRAR